MIFLYILFSLALLIELTSSKTSTKAAFRLNPAIHHFFAYYRERFHSPKKHLKKKFSLLFKKHNLDKYKSRKAICLFHSLTYSRVVPFVWEAAKKSQKKSKLRWAHERGWKLIKMNVRGIFFSASEDKLKELNLVELTQYCVFGVCSEWKENFKFFLNWI